MDFLTIDQVTGQSVRTGFIRLSVLKKLDQILWQGNSKLHELDEIYQAIVRYGFVDKPLWDSNLNEGRGGLVYGNGRAESLVLGLLKAQDDNLPRPKGIVEAIDNHEWCIPIGFGMDQSSELEAMSFAIDHNNLVRSGARESDVFDVALMWEEEGYAQVLRRLKAEESLPVTVDDDEFAQLMQRLKAEEDVAVRETEESDNVGDDYVPRVSENEIWKLGDHYIACGDSTLKANIDALVDVADISITMVWADPPYGISIVKAPSAKAEPDETKETAKKGKRGKGRIGSSNIAKANVYAPVLGDESVDIAVAATETYLDLFGDAVHCWWGGNYFAHVLPPSTCWIVWDKENTGEYADAELAWTNRPTAVRIFKHMWNGMIKASEHGQRRIHPTQKPIALARWFFESYGASGDGIVDPFLGSGMSIMAAEELGDRRVVGLDLSNIYCSLVCDRWENMTGLTAEYIGTLPES